MSAAEALGLPPGVCFDPTGDELIEYYLLPRALGLPPAVPGIIIEDDTATATAATSAEHPWKLLTRHRRTDDSEAYFFERVIAGTADDATTTTTKGAARQDRSCGGGRWTWKGQKRVPGEAVPLRGDGDGEHVSWSMYALNLHEGRSKGGSTGWVLHEYTVAASPQCPLLPVKICHVSFSGHGQKRQRVPDDDGGEGEGQELEPQATPQPPPHKRAATGSCMVTTATAMPDQELREARAQNQEQKFPNYSDYNPSSIGHFWSSDAGFSQESSIILDPSYPDDARSNHQELFALDQQLAQIQQCSASQSQEQFMFVNPAGSSAAAHCGALSASELGSSQEPQAWHLLAEDQQFSAAQLLGGISSPRCPPTTPAGAYQEEQHIQSFAPPADLPLSTGQEPCTTLQSHGNMDQADDFFRGWGWGDLNSFCDTSGIQDDDDMAAAQTLAAHGCGGGMSWDRHFFYQQPTL